MQRRSIPLALLALALGAGCHHEVEMVPLIERTIYVTDKFYDVQAIWWRSLPTGFGQYAVRDTPDMRSFLIDTNGLVQGFDLQRDVHQSVGGGLRFFLRSVAVPLIGFDAGWGIESRTWRFTLIIGA